MELLYGAYRMGPDKLGETLAQLRGELTPDLAQQALRDYHAAVGRQDADGAIAAATIASRIFNFIGHREDAFNALVDYFYVLFMLAETEAAYADVYTALRQVLAGDPYGEGSPLTGLRALMLAADGGFFACEAAADEARKKHWLQAALESLEDGAKYLGGAGTAELIPSYASTAVAVYRRCVKNGWVGEAWAAARLAAVTQALDRAAPGKVSYPGDIAKTANIDEARAEMSGLYNRGAYAGERRSGESLSGLFGRKGG